MVLNVDGIRISNGNRAAVITLKRWGFPIRHSLMNVMAKVKSEAKISRNFDWKKTSPGKRRFAERAISVNAIRA